MFSAEEIKQLLIGHLVPLIAGGLTAWVVSHTGLINLFGITEGELTGDLIEFGTFVVGVAVSWATTHKVLSGAWPSVAARKARAAQAITDQEQKLADVVVAKLNANAFEKAANPAGQLQIATNVVPPPGQ